MITILITIALIASGYRVNQGKNIYMTDHTWHCNSLPEKLYQQNLYISRTYQNAACPESSIYWLILWNNVQSFHVYLKFLYRSSVNAYVEILQIRLLPNSVYENNSFYMELFADWVIAWDFSNCKTRLWNEKAL